MTTVRSLVESKNIPLVLNVSIYDILVQSVTAFSSEASIVKVLDYVYLVTVDG